MTISASGAGGGNSASGSARSDWARRSPESRPSRRAARSRGPPRPTGQPLQGALDVGRAAAPRAPRSRTAGALDEELHQVEPALDLGAVGQRRGDALGQQAGAGAGQGAVDGGQQAAVAAPVEAFHQLEVAPRRRVDLHRAVGALAARRHQRRALAGLGQLHIVEQRAAGRDLGAREVAEALAAPRR